MARESGVRMVDEDTPVGGNVGAPVVDTDEPNDDRLTYSLRAADAPNAGDLSFFTIDQETGQITLTKKLTHEGTTADGMSIDARDYGEDGVTAGEYIVVVRATDPSGDGGGDGNLGQGDDDENFDEVTVTITALDVNEAPRIVTGNAELEVNENSNLPSPNDADDMTNRYQKLDEDANDIARDWSLDGADEALFELSTPGDGNIARRIHFRSDPDYENPLDMYRDNIYEVTLVVCDRAGDCGRKDVRIKVINMPEDGELTLSPRQPEPGVPVVATLTDDDGIMTEEAGVETIGTWQWYYTTTKEDYTVSGDFDNPSFVPSSPTPTPIEGATTNSYTPTMEDVGRYLHARVRYRDGMPPAPGESVMHQQLIAGTEFAVQVDPGPPPTPGQGNAAPAFDPMEVVFEVPENTPSTGFVGQHTRATDADQAEGVALTYGATDAEDDRTNPPTDLIYDLSGADADSFALASPNRSDYYAADATLELNLTPVQIAVKPVTHLDYESKKAYIFELGATDSEGARSFATVTVKISGVNEAPSAPVEFISGLGITGLSNITVSEVPEGADDSPVELGAYEATRLPRGASSVSWSLSGLDSGDFNISRDGVLTFGNPPNFEEPTDRERDLNDDGDTSDPGEEAAKNNRYEIMVRASAGSEVDTYGVTVTVGNVDEDGTVALPAERPEVDQAITATLTDPDGVISIDRWEWYKAELITDTFNLIPGPITDTYTPVAADANWWLRANVFYTDGEGAGKVAEQIAMGGTIQIPPMFDGGRRREKRRREHARWYERGQPNHRHGRRRYPDLRAWRRRHEVLHHRRKHWPVDDDGGTELRDQGYVHRDGNRHRRSRGQRRGGRNRHRHRRERTRDGIRRCHRQLPGERHGCRGDLHCGRARMRLRPLGHCQETTRGNFAISNGGELTFAASPQLRGSGGHRQGQRIHGNGDGRGRRRDG